MVDRFIIQVCLYGARGMPLLPSGLVADGADGRRESEELTEQLGENEGELGDAGIAGRRSQGGAGRPLLSDPTACPS